MVRVDTGLKLRLQEERSISPVPTEVCDSCHMKLSKLVSKGARLRAEAQAKDQARLMLWRNRINLVRQAKNLMAQKNFSDAAVAYEKYLRILEIVYDKEPGSLSPDLFRNGARKSELTVITSVYWDLMRIYDSHPRYADRQMKAAARLADFSRFTAIYPTIIRNAETQSRQARNTAAYKKFIEISKQKRPRCFIATSAFNGVHSDAVESLCQFRDHVLLTTAIGRRLTRLYYFISPPLAFLLDALPALKPPVRKILTCLARQVEVKFSLKNYGTSKIDGNENL